MSWRNTVGIRNKTVLEADRYRHELKYICSDLELRIVEQKLRAVMKPDPYADENGEYLIRSVYFDDYQRSRFFENEDGVDPREKFRIRAYNCSDARICLEKKIKHLPENIKHIWAYAISEMVNNVIDHSDGETMKVIVEQNYLTTSVRIIDDGVGIFEKIRSHFSFASIDEAICELFKGKLTTDEANHSGEGIFFTSRMMDSFYIVSDGKIFSTNRFDNDIILDEGENKKGTSVYMTLSNLTSRTAREIFDQYSSVDGGFTTTRIPLKNIFDTAPVSRSQAKRICNRLENFKEVIIDFDGISWIGQGFAHQIFVVFKNAHPDISITPIKMNESVEGMYLHVIKTV